MKTLVFAVVYCIVALIICADALAGDVRKDKPPARFMDVGACPFECCTYRQWAVRDSPRLLDRPNGKKVVGNLRKGEVVNGLTGVVISTPVAVKADRAIPETRIKAGDIFYILHYAGEGYWKVWFHGKITFVHQSVVNIPEPKSEWWVKVKKASGVVGWILSDKHFLHQDACE